MTKLTETSQPNLALVLGYIAVKDKEEDSEKVEILESLGFDNNDIAKICLISPNNVRVIKHRLKNKKSGKTNGSK